MDGSFRLCRGGTRQNIADHVQGYELGDFETQSTFDFGFGPGISSQGGVLYNGPASAVVGSDANNNPSGVWSDFGDIQPQDYSGNTNLLFYQQSTGGATHGSKAIQFYNVAGGAADGSTSSFNGMLELLTAVPTCKPRRPWLMLRPSNSTSPSIGPSCKTRLSRAEILSLIYRWRSTRPLVFYKATLATTVYPP